MDNNVLLGQVFDSMMRIRTFAGVKCVFGVITDFCTWRICWFPDSNETATTCFDLLFKYGEVNADGEIARQRKLCVSKVYKGSGGTGPEVSELSLAISSVLLKMHRSIKKNFSGVSYIGYASIHTSEKKRLLVMEIRNPQHYQTYPADASFLDQRADITT